MFNKFKFMKINKFFVYFFCFYLVIFLKIYKVRTKKNEINLHNNYYFTTNNYLAYNNSSVSINYDSLMSNKTFGMRPDLTQLIMKVIMYVYKYSNSSIIRHKIYDDNQCYNALINLIKNDNLQKDTLENILNSSGKGISDIGLEDDCIYSYNLTYLFINYTLNQNVSSSDPLFNNLYNFLEQSTFFTGICTWRECNDLYQSFFDYDLNQIFFDTLKDNYGVVNLTLYKMNYQEKKMENKLWENPRMKFFLICVWCFVAYISFRFVISFLGYLIYEVNSDSDENSSNEIPYNQNTSYNDTQLNYYYFNSTVNDTNRLHFITPKIKSKNDDQILNKSGFYCIYQIMSFRLSLNFLFKKKNSYYNEENLEILAGIRFYIFFFLTFLQNIIGITKLPHRDSTGYNYYSSFWFLFVKYSSHLLQCFAALNGVYLGYKIMNFIKKNKNKFELKHFFIFYLKSFLPIILFLISFFILHLYVRELGYMLKNLTIFEYFVDSNIYSKTCVKDPKILFIPFYLQYAYSEQEDRYIHCFRFAYFVMSEFYCFTFFLILVYFLMKIKSKKLDLFIYILNICNIIFSYFYFVHKLKNENSNYTLNSIYGEIFSIKYPHLFFNLYFIGINVGIMYFYYKDLLSSNPVIEKWEYNPFMFNFFMMKFIDKKSENFKKLIMIISTSVCILISLSFYFFQIFFNLKNSESKVYKNQIFINGNFIIDFIFIYEGKIFTLMFLIFLITLLLYQRDFSIKKILSSKLFTPMNRISFAFFISHDFIIVTFYALYNIQIYLNFQNTFFMTFALLVILVVFSFIAVILYELPLRILYKNMINKHFPTNSQEINKEKLKSSE